MLQNRSTTVSEGQPATISASPLSPSLALHSLGLPDCRHPFLPRAVAIVRAPPCFTVEAGAVSATITVEITHRLLQALQQLRSGCCQGRVFFPRAGGMLRLFRFAFFHRRCLQFLPECRQIPRWRAKTCAFASLAAFRLPFQNPGRFRGGSPGPPPRGRRRLIPWLRPAPPAGLPRPCGRRWPWRSAMRGSRRSRPPWRSAPCPAPILRPCIRP